MTHKKKYILNSFYFQKALFEQHLSKHFDFFFFPPEHSRTLPAWQYVPYNLYHLAKFYLTGAAQKYEVVQMSRAEAFWMFRKLPKQLSIFEIHGFDVGILGELYLRDLHSVWKKWLGGILDKIIAPQVIKKIQLADIFYVSTPDLVEPIHKWCSRRPDWLPNPIDIGLFTPQGETKKLEGNPVCFLAARLHGDKKPEVAIDIFKSHIKPEFPKATLHLIDTGELAEKYKKELNDPQTYFFHGYMDKPKLAATLRGADLIFGDFSIGALSLLPMQVMLLKKPIVTLDRYEIIKKEMEELPALAVALLRDEQLRKEYVETNYEYIVSTHSPEAVCQKHWENIEKIKPL